MTGSDPWFRPRGSAAHDGWDVHLPAPGPGPLHHAGLTVRSVDAGEHLSVPGSDREHLVIPLAGTLSVDTGSEVIQLSRDGAVFDAAPDVAYLPAGSIATIGSAHGARVALASAPGGGEHPVQVRRAAQVAVEHRGAPPALRQVRDLGGEHAVQAHRLLVCEVLTPPGGWSSYPPHKHDQDTPEESELEEVYYFEVQRQEPAAAERRGEPGDPPRAVAYHRTFASDHRPIDTLAEVRSGDVALVPYGWHGPCMAPPGHALYYLNVMAGPTRRTWQVTYHPDLEWSR